jgi:hypothetical protein
VRISTAAWALLYVLLSIDLTIRDKIGAARDLADLVRPTTPPAGPRQLAHCEPVPHRHARHRAADVGGDLAGARTYGRRHESASLTEYAAGLPVICLPLQHHFFQAHYWQSCDRPVVMGPHDGFAMCPEGGHCDTVLVKLPFIVTARPGRECYRVLRKGTVTVAQ